MMLIFQPDLEDYQVQVEGLAEVVRGLGGEVEKTDLWGKRRLAYPIAKQIEGVYALVTFKLATDKVRELERLVKLRSEVLRHLVVNLEEK